MPYCFKGVSEVAGTRRSMGPPWISLCRSPAGTTARRLLSMHALPLPLLAVPNWFHLHGLHILFWSLGDAGSGVIPFVEKQSGGVVDPGVYCFSYQIFERFSAAFTITTSMLSEGPSPLLRSTGTSLPWCLILQFLPR